MFGLLLKTSTRSSLPAVPARRHRLLELRLACRCNGGALDDRQLELIKKVRFPRQLGAFSVVAPQAVTFAVMLAILVVSLIFVPASRATVWLSIACSRLRRAHRRHRVAPRLNVVFRDVEHILTAALLPWFFLTPILWNFAQLPASAQSHRTLLDILRWGNIVTPPIYAVRDPIWLGHAPRLADTIYLLVAAAVALALGSAVFRRIDDRIAIEL